MARHNLYLEGYAFRLRPVEFADAQTIVDIRLEDTERNKYIHQIPSDVKIQEEWIEKYFERDDDYYFISECKFNGQAEGLIRVGGIKDKVATVDSLVVRKKSLAAIETYSLVLQIAFNIFQMDKVVGGCLAENRNVVSMQRRIGTSFEEIKKIEFDGEIKDYYPIYTTRAGYETIVQPNLEKLSRFIAKHFNKGSEVLRSCIIG